MQSFEDEDVLSAALLTKKAAAESGHSNHLSTITHELKTPLNAIISFAELLRHKNSSSKKSSAKELSGAESLNSQEFDNYISSEESKDCINEILQAANEMNELVNDLLDVEAAKSGSLSVDMSKSIDVKEVVRRSLKLNHGHAIKGNVTIRSEIADDVSLVKLDEKRLKQILTNLLSNALKYSPQRSEVKIAVSVFNQKSVEGICFDKLNMATMFGATNIHPLRKPFLQITITDQGFGMTEEQLKTAFNKYQTFNNPNSKIVNSFGLGLPIVKQLTELMKGTIEMKSTINQGTEVKLKFPMM
jgi:signal transduction histidine kinase